jgi:hypothetical protein
MSAPAKMLPVKPALAPVDLLEAAERAEESAQAALETANDCLLAAEAKHRNATATRAAATVGTPDAEVSALIATEFFATDRVTHARKAVEAARQGVKEAFSVANAARADAAREDFARRATRPIMVLAAEYDALQVEVEKRRIAIHQLFAAEVVPRNPHWQRLTQADVRPSNFYETPDQFIAAHKGQKWPTSLTGNVWGDISIRRAQADSEHVAAKGPAPELPFVDELDDEQRDRLYAALDYYGLGFVSVAGLRRTGVPLWQLYQLAGAPDGKANQTSAPVDLGYDDLARIVHFAHVTTEHRIPGGWDPVDARTRRIGVLAGQRLAARRQAATTLTTEKS